MKSLTISALILSSASATLIRGGKQSSRDLSPRIIGGDEANIGRYPYAVSLQDDMGHFCGGSLIAKDVVLSAAHCAGGRYKVVIGRHDLDNFSGDEIQMEYEIPHPNYNSRTTNNDYNLVFLQRPTTANVNLVNINADASRPRPGDPVTVMGWGDTVAADDIQRLSDVLRDVEVNVISNEECEKSKGYAGGWYQDYDGAISSSMLCAKDINEDSCQGDSGGPIVIRGNDKSGSDDVQVGVVSWGIGCATQQFPGVYARVSSVYDWIKDEVCNGSSDPPASFGCSSGSSNTGGNVSSGEEDGTGDGQGCESFQLDISTDGHASETYWKLEELGLGSSSSVLGSGPIIGEYADYTQYTGVETRCLTPGKYRFTMFDDYEDGIFAPGYYRISLNGNQLARNSNFGYKDVTEFTVGDNTSPNPPSTETNDTPAGNDDQNWIDILLDNFLSGFGLFDNRGTDVKYYKNVKDRVGVLRLQSGKRIESAIYSNKIVLDQAYSKLKISFSFYANSMESSDSFCLDYLIEESANWQAGRCWRSYYEFENDVWYDDVTLEFQGVSTIDSLRIRFRCAADSVYDDVLIDSVKIQGLE